MLALAVSAKQGHLISCCLQEAAVCYRYCSCRRYYPGPPRSSISSILIGLHHTATSRHTHTHSCTRADRNRCRHKCARKQRVHRCRPWHTLRLNICSKKMLICTWFPLSLTQITVNITSIFPASAPCVAFYLMPLKSQADRCAHILKLSSSASFF